LVQFYCLSLNTMEIEAEVMEIEWDKLSHEASHTMSHTPAKTAKF